MERSDTIRKILVKRLSRLWIKLDIKKNNKLDNKQTTISTKDSSIEIIVIPTNEELEIANETKNLLK